MKKTLIALIALVGSAGADVITAVDGVYTFGADDWAEKSEAGTCYTLSFADTVDLAENDWMLSFTATVKPSVGTNAWGTSVITSGNSPYPSGTHAGGFQYYVKVDGAVNIKGANLNNEQGTSMGVTLPKDTSAVYTFNISKIGTTTMYEILDSTGESLKSYVVQNYDWADKTLSGLSTSVGGEYVDSQNSANSRDNDQLNNGWSMPSGTFRVIPEPTTATLSLLALAGLAARRRRK